MSNKEKLLASAQKFLQKGQVARAIKDYEKLVELEPRDIRTKQKLAELYSRDRRTEEALDTYETVARHYTDNGFYLKAIAVYKQMQKVDPARVDTYHRLAELNEKQGLVGNALAEYRSLVAYYEKHGMLSEAIQVLQKMQELEPENLNIRVKIAETYAQDGLQEKAGEEFQEVLDQLRQKEDFPRILKLYQLLLPHLPEDRGLLAGQAEAFIETGEIGRGLELLQGLLQKEPDNAAVLKTLTLGYRKKEDFENERLTFRQLLKSDPENLDFREGAIRACLDLGDFGRALNELEEGREAFLAAGRVRQLKSYYEQLHAEAPDDRKVMDSLRSLYELSGEGEKLFTLLEDMPATDTAEEAAETEGFEGGEVPKVSSPAVVEEAESAAPGPTHVEPVTGSEPPPDAVAEDQAAEEIPLEFLEGVGDLVFDTPAVGGPEAEDEGAPVPEPDEAEVAEEELELELEIDLDLEEGADVVPPAASATGEPAAPVADEVPPAPAEAASEEVELELTDELLVVEDSAPVAAEAEAEVELLLEEEVGPEEPVVEPAVEPVEAGEGRAAGEALQAGLEEAEFYLQHGLCEEAEITLNELLAAAPDCPEAVAKLADVAAAREQAAAPAVSEAAGAATATPVEEKYVDLAGDLLDDVERALDEAGAGEPGDFGAEGGLDAAGVAGDQLDPEDAESHYNLGIAYKEMGLIDDAIAEFDKLANSSVRALDALTLKGICLGEKGEHAAAEQALLSGLEQLPSSAAEATSLRFELGLLYQSWKRPQQALEAFVAVAAEDPFFRDVGDRVAALREELGVDGEPGGEKGGGNGKKNRVSYV